LAVAISADHFVQVLPLLRRTFAQFRPRNAGSLANGYAAAKAHRLRGHRLRRDAARAVLPVLHRIWGTLDP